METGILKVAYGENGRYGDCFSPIIMERVSELGDITKDVECNLKESNHLQSLMIQKELCDTNKNISENGRDNLAATKDAECNVNKTVLENRYVLHDNIEKARHSIVKQLDYETDLIKLQMSNFETKVGERFCKVEGEIKDAKQAILSQLASDKLDEKNDTIARLRSKNERHEDRFIIANEISGLKTLINSIEQNQRFVAKTSVFGAGNIVPTTQLANQA